MSLVLWTIATWYVETRMERFVMGDENLVTDGDFEKGLPATPNWEYAGLSGEIWVVGEGIDGGGALRLGGDSTAFLRYRLSSDWRADGYFVGMCFKGDETATGASRSVLTDVFFRLGDLPPFPGVLTRPGNHPLSNQWHCLIETVSVPPALNELIIEIRPSPGPGLVWIDQVRVHPAIHPPTYRLSHQVIAIGWILVAFSTLAAVFHRLGSGPGLLAITPSAIALVLALVGTRALGELSSLVIPVLSMIDEISELLFEAMRVLTRDLSWRTVGEFQPAATLSLIIAGVFVALSVMLRYRWSERPWRKVIWYGALSGIAVQSMRLVFHSPTYASVNWVLDPMAVTIGIMVGAVLFELLLRPPKAPPPPD